MRTNRTYYFIGKQLDALVYSFIGPFAMLYVFPQFFLTLETKWHIQLDTPVVMDYIGTALMWVGASIAIWCGTLLFLKRNTISPFSSPTKLLRSGLYKYVRHPMMWAIHIVLIGEIIVFNSPLLILWFLVWLRFAVLYIDRYEEPYLYSIFGEKYMDYCKTTPKWFPVIKKRNNSNTGFP